MKGHLSPKEMCTVLYTALVWKTMRELRDKKGNERKWNKSSSRFTNLLLVKNINSIGPNVLILRGQYHITIKKIMDDMRQR